MRKAQRNPVKRNPEPDFVITPMVKSLLLEKFAPRVFHVKSDTNPDTEYNITLARNHIDCTCKDYLYRSRDKEGYKKIHYCKHIKTLCKQLLETPGA